MAKKKTKTSIDVGEMRDNNQLHIHLDSNGKECIDCIRKEMQLLEMDRELKKLKQAFSQLLELTP